MPIPFPVTPMNPAYAYLIPHPYHYAVHEGFFSFERPVRVSDGLEQIASRLEFFGAKVNSSAAASIELRGGAGVPEEGFTLEVMPDRIVLMPGGRIAFAAFTQRSSPQAKSLDTPDAFSRRIVSESVVGITTDLRAW